MRRDLGRWGEGFPFDVPAVAAIDRLRLDAAPITLLAGDNGTGKSAIVEAIAQAIASCPRAGSSSAPVSCRPCRGRSLTAP